MKIALDRIPNKLVLQKKRLENFKIKSINKNYPKCKRIGEEEVETGSSEL